MRPIAMRQETPVSSALRTKPRAGKLGEECFDAWFIIYDFSMKIYDFHDFSMETEKPRSHRTIERDLQPS